MRAAGLKSLAAALALGLLASSPPALTLARESPPTARGSDTARYQPGAESRALDAAGDPGSKTIAEALAASGVEQANLPNLKDEDRETLTLTDELSRNDALIAQRSGTAIPAWLIGDGPARKGFNLARLRAAIAEARAGKNH